MPHLIHKMIMSLQPVQKFHKIHICMILFIGTWILYHPLQLQRRYMQQQFIALQIILSWRLGEPCCFCSTKQHEASWDDRCSLVGLLENWQHLQAEQALNHTPQ